MSNLEEEPVQETTPAPSTLRVLIEVVHPAHVLFFVNPIRILRARGHDVFIASRDKDVTLSLLDELGLKHTCASYARPGLFGLAMELVQRNVSIWRLAKQIRPSLMCGFGGVSISQVGCFSSIPAIGFYDTDHAVLQQRLTLPFLNHQYVPMVYDGPTRKGRCTRFAGIKAISYLHPRYFKPCLDQAINAGLDSEKPNYVIRVVNWQSNHDVGKKGWSAECMRAIVDYLLTTGKVHISSEGELPPEIASHRFNGKAADFHHLLAFSDLYIGESATVATEAAMLGVPAIHAVDDRRSYIDELHRLGLVESTTTVKATELKQLIARVRRRSRNELLTARDCWLKSQVDLAQYVVDRIESHAIPCSLGHQ